MAKAWGWVKKHGAMVIAILAGLVVAFYLFFRPSSSGTPVASTVSFPAGGGGGGGSTGGSAPPPPAANPATPALPYSPDFGVLQAIADAALRALYEKEYNLETQINEATLQGNTSLVNALASALSNVQDQIANYQPPASTPAPTSTPNAPTLNANFADNLIAAYLAAQQKLGKSFNGTTLWEQFFESQGIDKAYADYVQAQSNAYTQATGMRATTAQLQNWLNEAYKKVPAPTGS